MLLNGIGFKREKYMKKSLKKKKIDSRLNNFNILKFDTLLKILILNLIV